LQKGGRSDLIMREIRGCRIQTGSFVVKYDRLRCSLKSGINFAIYSNFFNSSSDKAFSSLFISNKAFSSLFISNKAFSSLFISNKAFHHSSYPTKRFLLPLISSTSWPLRLLFPLPIPLPLLRLLVLASFYVPPSCQPSWNPFQNMTPSRPARPRPQNKR